MKVPKIICRHTWVLVKYEEHPHIACVRCGKEVFITPFNVPKIYKKVMKIRGEKNAKRK